MLSFPLISDVIPVKFHPYTSGTRKTLLRIDYHNDRSDDPTYRQIEHFRKNLHLLFTGHDIKNHVDNKIVFECEVNGTRTFFGFYDLCFSIGLDYFDENEGRR